jgi:DNA-binding NarL/FixJ family response regulator
MVVSELEDMRLVVDLTSIRDDVAVVALVPEVTPQIVREAVIAGVTSVATWDASPEEVDSLLHAALESRSMVPTSVLEKLVKSSRVSGKPVDISREETEWLQALASGETVSQLAERISYSEREVYRLLRALYERLGVRSRVEALVWAAQHGVVHE